MKIFIFLLAFSCMLGLANAGWKDPVEYLSGDWSKSDLGFGLQTSESEFSYPDKFCTTATGYFIIADKFNNRVKIYSEGALYKIIMSPEDMFQWPETLYCVGDKIITSYSEIMSTYDISGLINKTIIEDALIYAANDSYVGTVKGTTYKLYDNTLNLIKTDIVPFKEIAYLKNKNIYMNNKLIFRSNYDNIDFKVDNNNIIVLDPAGQVTKYNKCGQVISSVTLSDEDVTTVGDSEFEEGTIIRNTEVSTPYISRNGDIYEPIASDNGFKILKYVWVDSPVPTYTPLPPLGLKKTILGLTIRISWDNAEQDPGCVTGYEIWRSEDPNGTFVRIATINSDLQASFYEYDDKAVVVGKRYHYKIRTIVDDTYSTYSTLVDGLVGSGFVK